MRVVNKTNQTIHAGGRVIVPGEQVVEGFAKLCDSHPGLNIMCEMLQEPLPPEPEKQPEKPVKQPKAEK